LRRRTLSARAVHANLAHAAQIAAGAQPLAHVIVAFVPPAAALCTQHIDLARDQLIVDLTITTLCTGAALAEIYEPAPTAVAATKIAASHGAALRAIDGAMRAVIQGRTAVQSHAQLISLITAAVLENWRTNIQGYSAAELAKANIVAVEMALQRPILIATVQDSTVVHCNAFAVVNVVGTLGYAERLATSVVRVCEPGLRTHLQQSVPEDELVRQVHLGTASFVHFMASHAKLAQAKSVADGATRAATSTVAALEVQVAGLRAEQSRLEQRLQEQAQQREQQQQQQQQQQQGRNRNCDCGQRARCGQVPGSPDYSGCNFCLPGGAHCGNMEHARRDHPR
jgi:hypothetical protein